MYACRFVAGFAKGFVEQQLAEQQGAAAGAGGAGAQPADHAMAAAGTHEGDDDRAAAAAAAAGAGADLAATERVGSSQDHSPVNPLKLLREYCFGGCV